MKKIRIIGKSPRQILRTENKSTSPHRQSKPIIRQHKIPIKFQERRIPDVYSKLSYRENTKTHRYKQQSQSPLLSPFGIYYQAIHHSPKDQVRKRSKPNRLSQDHSDKINKPRGLRQLARRSTDKSPYLNVEVLNRSQRRIMMQSKNSIQLERKNTKQLEPVHYNSLEAKSNSFRLKRDKDTGSLQTIQQAHKLTLAGEPRKSLFILKSVLAKDPSNLQALEIAAVNLFGIGDFLKSAQYLDSIISMKKDYSINVYFLRAKIYLKLNNNFTKCIQTLEECLSLFPESEEQILIERGQIYMSMHKYLQAIEYFQAVQKKNSKSILAYEKLIIVYESLKEFQNVVDTINKLYSVSPIVSKKYNIAKCKCYQQLDMPTKILEQFSQGSDDSALFYYIGWAYYTKNDRLKAYLAFESSLLGQNDCTKSIKFMLLILCRDYDFYQAYHLIERCDHLNVNKRKLTKEFGFVEGTLCLMKKNVFEGIEKLNQVLAEINAQLNNKQDEFGAYASTQINGFLAYGHFVLGNFELCQKHYKMQVQNFPNVKIEGMEYNRQLNQAFLLYKEQKLEESLALFEKSNLIYPKKVQPIFSIAIVYVNMYLASSSKNSEQKKNFLEKSKLYLKEAAILVQKANNNMGANIFYHRSVLYGYLNEWREAIADADEAIHRSEENYWRFFYLKALILACVHNFSDAISNCTTAINLKQKQPHPYLLRARCFQIEGEGSYAFKDLQKYIALRPENKQIHILAGKFLFENGAFEDAISAFNHQQISQIKSNYDAFMTKSKTFFLLGRFIQAGQQMATAHRVDPTRKEAQFDSKMMLLLKKLVSAHPNYPEVLQEIDKIYENDNSAFTKAQIFKQTQKCTLKATCYFYMNKYEQVLKEFQNAIATKQKLIMRESLIEGAVREDEKDTRLFGCQMNFNIALCYLMMGQHQQAQAIAQDMNIFPNDPFYSEYKKFLSIFKGHTSTIIPGKQKQVIQIEVFPSRNKISNFLNPVVFEIKNQTVCTKLCIPFPKVEPPDIFPTFDENLLQEFSINRVQRKPEAPWICRQQNAIVFTSKIQKYSRLQIQQSSSQISKSMNQVQQSQSSILSNTKKITHTTNRIKKKANSYNNQLLHQF